MKFRGENDTVRETSELQRRLKKENVIRIKWL